MHRRHRALCLAAMLLATLVLAAPATAANGSRVLADWRADGSIDGTYTMADLRDADSRVNEQEREYTFWNDAYADAVRRLSDPDAPDEPRKPPTVPPQDFDNDGDIDAKDIATAKKETIVLRKKFAKEQDTPEATPVDDDEETSAAASKGDDDDGGLGWVAALLFLIPAAIIGGGAWRMQRSRGAKGSRDAVLDHDAPTSSFAGDDQP